MKNIKIACDNQVSKITVDTLDSIFTVVTTAGNKPDDVWLEEAIDKGATVFISPDLDVPNYLDSAFVEYKWIDIPQGLGKQELCRHLIKQIKKVIKL